MSQQRTLLYEVKRFKDRFQVLQRLFSETEECLGVVDYNNLLDRELLQGTVLDQTGRNQLKGQLDVLPRFLILGSSSKAKVTVFNRLLSLPDASKLSVDGDGVLYEGDTAIGLAPNLRIKYGEMNVCDMGESLEYESVHGVDILRSGGSSSRSRGAQRGAESGPQSLSSRSGSKSRSWSAATSLSERRSSTLGNIGNIMELSLNHELLACGADIFVPDYTASTIADVVEAAVVGRLPIVIYAFGTALTELDVDSLHEMSVRQPQVPIFFLRSRDSVGTDLPESDWHGQGRGHGDRKVPSAGGFSPGTSPADRVLRDRDTSTSREMLESLSLGAGGKSSCIVKFLTDLGYLPVSSSSHHGSSWSSASSFLLSSHSSNVQKKRSSNPDDKRRFLGLVTTQVPGLPALRLRSYFVDSPAEFGRVASFFCQVAQVHWVQLSASINAMHSRMLQVFIMTAYDMQRDKAITPKRIEFARQKEEVLFDQLLQVTNDQQAEIKTLITSILSSQREEVIQSAKTWCCA